MKIEIPDVQRCCCCLPLRYGIIVWSYIKLILFVLLLIVSTIGVVQLFRILIYHGRAFYPEFILLPLFVLVLLVDVLLTIVFLIGGHRKSLRVMKLFYIYSIVILCIMTVVFVIFISIDIYVLVKYANISSEYSIGYAAVLKINFVSGLIIVGLEAYFVMMLRSEVRKLSNICDFRFSNNATEAECVMQKEISAKEDEINVDELVY